MMNALRRIGLSGLLGVGLLSLVALPLAASDLSGDWKVTGDVAGNAVDAVCTLKQDSNKLSGICKGDAGGTPLKGEVTEAKVTFQYDIDYQGQTYTLVYAATLKSETAMEGTIDAGVANGGFTAKKQ